MPRAQRDLVRVSPIYAPYVDQALRETARQLLSRGKHKAKKLPAAVRLDPSNEEQVVAWSMTATFLCARIQTMGCQRPGPAPMGCLNEAAALEIRAVLQRMWWQAWAILRRRDECEPSRER